MGSNGRFLFLFTAFTGKLLYMGKILPLKCLLLLVAPLAFSSCSGAVSISYEKAYELAEEYFNHLYELEGQSFLLDLYVTMSGDSSSYPNGDNYVVYSPTHDYYSYFDGATTKTVFENEGTMTLVTEEGSNKNMSTDLTVIDEAIDEIGLQEFGAIFSFAMVLGIIFEIASPSYSSSDNVDSSFLDLSGYEGTCSFSSFGEGSLIAHFEGVNADNVKGIMEVEFASSLPSRLYSEEGEGDSKTYVEMTFSSPTTEEQRVIPNI